jgi:hypothetical protein
LYRYTQAIRRIVQVKMGALTPFQVEVMMHASCVGPQLTAEVGQCKLNPVDP